MSDLHEALKYWREGILEGQSDNITQQMAEDKKHFDTLYLAARRWASFPTDEDVEAAVRAEAEHWAAKEPNQTIEDWLRVHHDSAMAYRQMVRRVCLAVKARTE